MVKGKEEDLDAMVDAIRDGLVPFSFEKVIPQPSDINDSLVLSTSQNMRRRKWRDDNWGTKWNLDTDTMMVRTKGRVHMTFNTAWAPPTPVIIALVVRFPALKFHLKWWESGSGFKGVLKGEDGAVVESHDEPYHGTRGG